jgi:hypothetical protein
MSGQAFLGRVLAGRPRGASGPSRSRIAAPASPVRFAPPCKAGNNTCPKGLLVEGTAFDAKEAHDRA